MTFQEYINHSWKIHAKETDSVYQSLFTAAEKISSIDDFFPLARLITHMCGDHLLQNSQKGVELLGSLKTHPLYKPGTDAEVSINRSMAILKLSAGDAVEIQNFALSDQVRIYAQTSGIMVEHKNFELGQKYFEKAMSLASHLDEKNKSEPAFKAIGVTTNNVTCTLEEKPDRTEAQTKLMIQMSLANLKYWGLAGGYDDVNMAEYRLSNTYVQAGQIETALGWAKKCYFGILEHKLSPYFEFYGLEMMTLCHSLLKQNSEVKKYQQLLGLVYEKLSADEKKSTEKTFNKTMALV